MRPGDRLTGRGLIVETVSAPRTGAEGRPVLEVGYEGGGSNVWLADRVFHVLRTDFDEIPVDAVRADRLRPGDLLWHPHRGRVVESVSDPFTDEDGSLGVEILLKGGESGVWTVADGSGLSGLAETPRLGEQLGRERLKASDQHAILLLVPRPRRRRSEQRRVPARRALLHPVGRRDAGDRREGVVVAAEPDDHLLEPLGAGEHARAPHEGPCEVQGIDLARVPREQRRSAVSLDVEVAPIAFGARDHDPTPRSLPQVGERATIDFTLCSGHTKTTRTPVPSAESEVAGSPSPPQAAYVR